jgi:hypothetical protein
MQNFIAPVELPHIAGGHFYVIGDAYDATDR